MTLDKDRKRVIGNRTRPTGEPSSPVRRRVVARGAKKTDAATRQVDHAAVTGMSNEKIKAQTGHTWDAWVRLLTPRARQQWRMVLLHASFTTSSPSGIGGPRW